MTFQADVVVAGPGVAPGLVALVLAEREPSLRVALLTADAEIGGNNLDLILPRRLPERFQQLLAPIIVAEWERSLVNLPESSAVLAEPVQLVDPVQLWLQLAERIDPAAMITGCAGFEQIEDQLCWAGGEIACAKLIDLSERRSPERQAEFVGAGDLAGLDCPVLADLAAAGEHYDHLQYIPLGDGRIVINRFVTNVGGALERTGFTTGRVDDLPVLRFWRDLGELCSGLMRS